MNCTTANPMSDCTLKKKILCHLFLYTIGLTTTPAKLLWKEHELERNIFSAITSLATWTDLLQYFQWC